MGDSVDLDSVASFAGVAAGSCLIGMLLILMLLLTDNATFVIISTEVDVVVATFVVRSIISTEVEVISTGSKRIKCW